MTAFPTPEDVARTAEMVDLVVRNLQVTRGYYLFSTRLRDHAGGEATWPTFAAWASAQAGRTVRKEDLLRALERRLGDSPAVRRLVEGPLRLGAKFILRAVLGLNPFERSSQAVSRGNIKVYAEIGTVFARFLQLLESDPTDAATEALACSLAAGPPPDGQDLLKRAFPVLFSAIKTPAGKARSELILLANTLIGLHEQSRLQPEIVASMDGAVWDAAEIKSRLADLLLPHAAPLRRLGRVVLRETLLPSLESLLDDVQTLVREIITERMMVLELPGETLRLGHDLSGAIPEVLRQLENAELRKLLTPVDPTPGSLDRTAALNWADFNERMHFIADLFRARQFAQRLFEDPASLA
jgi:hypothetical protein